jgi:hypothetical protein
MEVDSQMHSDLEISSTDRSCAAPTAAHGSIDNDAARTMPLTEGSTTKTFISQADESGGEARLDMPLNDDLPTNNVSANSNQVGYFRFS